MPIKGSRRFPMETINLGSGRERISSPGQIITREEYDALISGLTLESKPEPAAPTSETDARVKRLEFNMMVLVGLILVVFILCRAN